MKSKNLLIPDDNANLDSNIQPSNVLAQLFPLVGTWLGEGKGSDVNGNYSFKQQITISHSGSNYLNWDSRLWRLDNIDRYESLIQREIGFWKFTDKHKYDKLQNIEFTLSSSAGCVELFYGKSINQVSWELITDILAYGKSKLTVGRARRLYGVVEGFDLAYIEERLNTNGILVPSLSARLSRVATR